MNLAKLFLTTTVLVAGLLASSCVNEAYDFSKPIDMTVAIDGDITIPVIKNSKFIDVGSFLKLDEIENSPIIQVGMDGDVYSYAISMKSEEPFGGNFGRLDFDLSESFKNFVPEAFRTQDVDLTGHYIDLKSAIDADPAVIEMILGQLGLSSTISVVGMTPRDINKYIADFKSELDRIQDIAFKAEDIQYPAPIEINVAGTGNNSMPIEIIYEDFPAIVDDVADIETDIELTFKLGPSFGKIVLEKGFEIDFPDRIRLEALETSQFWSLDRTTSTIRVTKDFPVYPDTELKLRIAGIEASGCVTKAPDGSKSLNINERIAIYGNTVCDIKEFLADDILMDMRIPDRLNFKSVIAFNDNVNIGDIRVKLDLASQMDMIEDQEIELGQILPETITADNIVLDIYNPVIILDVVNDSPLAATLNGTIDAYKNGNSVFGGTPVILDGKIGIDAESVKRIAISRRGSERNDIDQDVIIDNLGELISSLPEKITIENLGIEPKGEYITINLDDYSSKDLGFSCNYEVYAPLAFGDKLKIDYELEPIVDLNSYFDMNPDSSGPKIKLNELNVDFCIDNSLPLSLGLKVTPLDIEGEKIETDDLNLEIKFSNSKNTDEILSGKRNGNTTESQRTSVSIKVSTKSLDVLKKLDGISIVLTGNAGDAVGIALNSAQGIMLTNMKAHISGGLEVNLYDMMGETDFESEE